MTVNYVYLGYGTTDSDGIAKLDHDADGEEIEHSYTGTGAGEIDVIASLDNASTISDSSIQSAPYEILDTLFKDCQQTGDDSKWTKSNCTTNVTEEGTECTPSANWGSLTVPNGDYFDKMPFVIEFEVVALTGYPRLYFYSGTQYSPNQTGKYVATVTSSGITVKKGETTVGTFNPPSSNTTIAWSFPNSTDRLTFKDFKIYPI